MNETTSHRRPTPDQNTEDWQNVAEQIGGTFVVCLYRGDGRHLTRCYLTVKAAQAAAERARQRGQSCTVVLSELKPLYRVTPGEESWVLA
jgi:hypothetical protein